jgi:hypothetical protein
MMPGMSTGNYSAVLSLQEITVASISTIIARQMIVKNHYLHSFPGGTMLSLGVFAGGQLLGALTLGAGPAFVHSLVEGACRDDCLTLTRLWLADELPANSESRTIGMVIRSLRKYTDLKFLISYADPTQGHLGTIYQATNWLYIGLSTPMPLYDLGDGIPRHSRSVAQVMGTHSIKYLSQSGLKIKCIEQQPKHRYLIFLNKDWRRRLNVPVLPYPKKEDQYENH